MNNAVKKYKDGFSLIELMVVIVIVIILALALTPLFKEEIEKARYSEGISALGALNTKIKVYIAENNALPGTTNAPAASLRVVRAVNSTNDSYAFQSTGSPGDDNANLKGRPKFQIDLGIGFSEYEGRYFKQDHYQYLNDIDLLAVDGTYLYGVAVVGGPGSGGTDLSKAGPGTYYAICVRQTSNEFITVTKGDYTPDDKREKRLVDNSWGGLTATDRNRAIRMPGFSSTASDITTLGWK